MKFLIFTIAFSASLFSAEAKYFYSLPQEAGPEWGYLIPECKILTEKVLKCEKTRGLEKCRMDKSVELTDTLTKKKHRFAIDYLVFKTKAACDEDRLSILAGDA